MVLTEDEQNTADCSSGFEQGPVVHKDNCRTATDVLVMDNEFHNIILIQIPIRFWRDFSEASRLAYRLTLQMAPTFSVLERRAYHRDVNSHNVLISSPDGDDLTTEGPDGTSSSAENTLPSSSAREQDPAGHPGVGAPKAAATPLNLENGDPLTLDTHTLVPSSPACAPEGTASSQSHSQNPAGGGDLSGAPYRSGDPAVGGAEGDSAARGDLSRTSSLSRPGSAAAGTASSGSSSSSTSAPAGTNSVAALAAKGAGVGVGGRDQFPSTAAFAELGMDFWLIDFGLAVSAGQWRGSGGPSGGGLMTSFHGHDSDALWKQHDIVGRGKKRWLLACPCSCGAAIREFW